MRLNSSGYNYTNSNGSKNRLVVIMSFYTFSSIYCYSIYSSVSDDVVK